MCALKKDARIDSVPPSIPSTIGTSRPLLSIRRRTEVLVDEAVIAEVGIESTVVAEEILPTAGVGG